MIAAPKSMILDHPPLSYSQINDHLQPDQGRRPWEGEFNKGNNYTWGLSDDGKWHFVHGVTMGYGN